MYTKSSVNVSAELDNYLNCSSIKTCVDYWCIIKSDLSVRFQIRLSSSTKDVRTPTVLHKWVASTNKKKHSNFILYMFKYCRCLNLVCAKFGDSPDPPTCCKLKVNYHQICTCQIKDIYSIHMWHRSHCN